MASTDDPRDETRRPWLRRLAGWRDGTDLGARIGRLEAEHGPLPANFDANRYVELHRDLARFRGDAVGATEHFLRWGRDEGRLYRSKTELLEDRYGQLPADFDAARYMDLHPDLEIFRSDADAAAAHYLQSGRLEGRRYKRLPAAAEAARPVDLDAKAARAEPPVPDRRRWRSRFNAADFRALNPDLADRIRDRTEALQLFETEGIARLAPLSLDDPFDADFYRRRTPEAAMLDPPEAYRHWLDVGMVAGRAGSESELVEALIGTRVFPSGFDWETYLRLVGPRAGTTRSDALDHAIETGIDDPANMPVRGKDAAAFLEAAAASQWKRARRRLAVGMMERAIALRPDHARQHWTLAAWREELGDLDRAETHYRKAERFGYRSVYLVAKLAELAAGRGEFDRAYAQLYAGRAAFAGYGPWSEALDATLSQDFSTAAEAALDHYRKGERGEGDARLTATLGRITHQLEKLDDLPAPLRPMPDGPVVLFANHGLPQCRHYRVEQRCRQLDRLAIAYRLFDSDDAAKTREALVGARALVVYREPAYVETIRLILHARAMGVPVVYEIDDLIFDAAHYPDSFDTYGKQIPFEDYVGLLYGVPLFRFAATLCDAGIASTEALAGHLGPLTRSGACAVIPNGLDERNARFLAAAPVACSTADDILIFYGSGTKAHDRNFNETVGPALTELFAARPKVKLVVVGYLDLGAGLAPFADRILRVDFSRDLEAYWAALSEADINLAVLVPGVMNDAKSEIKWLEAAVSAVPSVVSATATYRAVLHDGHDALLCTTPEDWRTALFRLIDDAALRRSIGRAARAKTIASYGLEATAGRLAAVMARPEPPPPARRKMRLMIVNVLFPPQTFGGATRVVRDNVDDLVARYGGEFELAVYATDFDALPETSRVGRYGTVPAFRYGRQSADGFDYRDDSAGDHFAAVIGAWAPDLVHFHCIQFLTGSIVERCHAAGIPYLVTVHDGWWVSPSQFLVDEDLFLRLPGPRALTDGPSDKDALTTVDRKRYLADRLNEAAAVTAVSASFADLYRHCGVPDIRVTPNGLSARFLEARDRPGRRDRAGAGRHERVRIGHIGGRSHHKGIHLLQIALQQGAFAHLEALVIDHAEEVGYEAQELWGTTPVTVRGSIPQDGVFDLYDGLDVLVAPSTWPESFGLVSREALTLGLWVVVSGLGALAEDVVEGENGFVIDVGDARDLIRVLRLIDADPERFTRSPEIAFEPRPATRQTDDFVAIYREIAAVRDRG
ncbi:MAG TPA: glycosyltransferase [Lichenihabitans sp.]|nr:glycosyltransferase [Lichenihabitans sp.]